MARNINVILTLQDQFTKKMSAASYETLMFKKQLGLAQAASGGFEKVMHKMERAAIVGASAVTGAVTVGAKSTLDAYAGFESKMNEVAGIKGLDKFSVEGKKVFNELTAAAKESANQVKGATYTEAAEGLKYLALAGWNTRDSIKALIPTLQAVKINGVDTKETVDAFTDSMTALELKADQAQDFVNLATAVQGASNTNMLQLNNALIKSGAGFQDLYARAGNAQEKLEVVKDTMAMIGVLSSGGFKDTKAGTILNSLFTRMTKESGETNKGLEAIGLSLYNNAGKLKSPLKIFTEMNDRVKDLNDQERNNALSMIGGRYRSQLVQVINAMNTVDDDGKTAIEKINDAMERSGKAAQTYIDAITSGYSGALATLAAEWEDFKIDTGELIAPYAAEGLEYIRDNILPDIGQWLKNKLPSALETGRNIVKDIRDILVESKPVIQWIGDHFKEIAVAAGTIYAGMGAFRLGTGAVTAYTDLQKALEGGRKIAETRELAYGVNLRGLTVPGLNKDGSVSKSKRVPIDTSAIFSDGSLFDNLKGAEWNGRSMSPLSYTMPEVIGTAVASRDTTLPSAALTPPLRRPKGLGEVIGESERILDDSPIFSDSARRNMWEEMYESTAEAPVRRGIFSRLFGSADDIAAATMPGAGSMAMAGITEAGAAAAGTAGLSGVSTAAAGGVGGSVIASGGLSGLAAAVGPIAAVVGTVTALVGGIVAAYKNSEKLREALGKFKESISPGLEKIKDAFKELGPVWEGLKKVGGEFFGLVGDKLAPVITLLGPFVNSFLEIAGMGLKAVFEGIAGALDLVGDAISGIRQILAPVFELLQKVADKFREVIGLAQQGPFASNNPNDYDFSNGGGVATALINRPKTDVDTNTGRSEAEGGEYNALGTSYWKGGRTVINDARGGEIVDLPRGSRVIPADKSEKMVKNMGKGITVNVNVERFYGDDEGYINNMANRIAGKLAAVM